MKTDTGVVCAQCKEFWPLKNCSLSTKKKILKAAKGDGWAFWLGTVKHYKWELRITNMEFFCPHCSREEELTWIPKSGQK